jgi:hypothetical protein
VIRWSINEPITRVHDRMNKEDGCAPGFFPVEINPTEVADLASVRNHFEASRCYPLKREGQV